MASRLFRERLRCKRGRIAALLTLLLGSTLSSPSAFAFGSHPPAAANTVGAMREISIPLHRRHEIDVVSFGNSLHASDDTPNPR